MSNAAINDQGYTMLRQRTKPQQKRIIEQKQVTESIPRELQTARKTSNQTQEVVTSPRKLQTARKTSNQTKYQARLDEPRLKSANPEEEHKPRKTSTQQPSSENFNNSIPHKRQPKPEVEDTNP